MPRRLLSDSSPREVGMGLTCKAFVFNSLATAGSDNSFNFFNS